MTEAGTGRLSLSNVPESVRVPLGIIGVLGLITVSLGLYVLSVTRDRGVEDAVSETELLAALLLDDAGVLQGDQAAAALARAVLQTEGVRAAGLVLGDSSLTVGPDAPLPTDEDLAAAVGTGEPVVTRTDGSAVVTTAFARLDGAPVAVTSRTPLRSITVGWAGLALAWAAVAIAIVASSITMERRRRDRVITLEDTVKALYAHDTEVTRLQQELLRSKTEFVNAISQELRTPLEVIKGVANRLASGGELTDGQRRDLVDGLRLNADRLDTVLGDLIDVDRLTQRTVTVRRRPVRVQEALDAALEDIDTSQHVLAIAVGDVTAHATAGHVERILRSLVHNAVKYAPVGSTISVGAERQGDAVVLRVDDAGAGIPVTDRAAVFEPLRQLADDPGMGLGLALVKRFAELHGGRAWVEEAPGGGAAFRVLLPDEGDPVRVDSWRVTGAHADSEHGTTAVAP